MSKVYYIKPDNFDFPAAIKDGFLKALEIVRARNISNIKFIVSHSDLVESPPNHISAGIDQLFQGKGAELTIKLKRDRGFPIVRFPTVKMTTGVNLILANNNPTFAVSETVGLLIWADYDSFIKIESALFHNQIDLVGVVYNETKELNELLSATKGENISTIVDVNVQPYVNAFNDVENEILGRLKSINIGDGPTHNPTKLTMDNVIAELKKKKIQISYKDFLGYLINEVNYRLDNSVGLLDRKHAYFGR